MMNSIIYLNDDYFIYNMNKVNKSLIDRQIIIGDTVQEYKVGLYSLNAINEKNKIDERKIVDRLFDDAITNEVINELLKYRVEKEDIERIKNLIKEEIFNMTFYLLRTSKVFYEVLIDIFSRCIYEKIKKDKLFVNFNLLRYILYYTVFYKADRNIGIIYHTYEYISKKTRLHLNTVRNNIRKLEYYGLIDYVVGNKCKKDKFYIDYVDKIDITEVKDEFEQAYNNNTNIFMYLNINRVMDFIENSLLDDEKKKIRKWFSNIMLSNKFLNDIINNIIYRYVRGRNQYYDGKINLYKSLEKRFGEYVEFDRRYKYVRTYNFINYFEDFKKKKLGYGKIVDEYFMIGDILKKMFKSVYEENTGKTIKNIKINLLKIDNNFVNRFSEKINDDFRVFFKEDSDYYDLLDKIIKSNVKGILDYVAYTKKVKKRDKKFYESINKDEVYITDNIVNIIKFKMKKFNIIYTDIELYYIIRKGFECVNDKASYLYNLYKTFNTRSKSILLILHKLNSFLDRVLKVVNKQ